MARDLAFQASALKEAAEYQVAATFYVDQAGAYFDRVPKRAAGYYRAAICVLEHARGLLSEYPLGTESCADIEMRIATFLSFATELETRESYLERGGHRG